MSMNFILENFIPDTNQLATIFSQAAAPAFLLGAVAAFTQMLLSRLTHVIDRIRSLNEIADSDSARVKLKTDIPDLKLRAVLLHRAAYLALTAGIATTLLLMIWIVSAFLKLQHVYGGGLLFGVASALLGLSLYNFAREVKVALSDFDQP